MLHPDLEPLARPASVLEVGGFEAPDDPFTSWYGTVRAAREGELWPRWGGRSMVGVCQLYLADAPRIPPILEDLACITVFMADEGGRPAPPFDALHGQGWLVRGYTYLDSLVPIEPPLRPSFRGLPGRWIEVEADLPDWEDASEFLEPSSELWGSYYQFAAGAHGGIKIGGWPSLIQSNLPWKIEGEEPLYAFQLDSDPKTGINWVDRGTVYIARNPKRSPNEQWQSETQFY